MAAAVGHGVDPGPAPPAARPADGAGVDDDQAYDLLLAACEAATNAVEHAQEPTEPYVASASRARG